MSERRTWDGFWQQLRYELALSADPPRGQQYFCKRIPPRVLQPPRKKVYTSVSALHKRRGLTELPGTRLTMEGLPMSTTLTRSLQITMTPTAKSYGYPLIAAIAALGLTGCTANFADFDEAANADDSNEIAAESMALTSNNGLSTNGLSTNGLSSISFKNWFNGQQAGVAYTNTVMHYVVLCSVPLGQIRSATINSVTYTWFGLFGLAPTWSSGQTIPLAEQELVSACLAAHVNKYGANVLFSVLGYDKNNVPIPSGPTELLDFTTKEGCFFGNLFNGDGTFVGNDSTWGTNKSSSRNCAITTRNTAGSTKCPPMTYANDSCAVLCTPNAAQTAYTSCTYNGKSYRPITTRVLSSSIYTCGDGICQISERCGTGRSPDDCKDCGPCL